MSTTTVDKTISGYTLAYGITSIVTAILVVIKETVPIVHDVMASMTGHHWVTQGVFNIVLLLILGYVFSKKDLNWSSSKVIQVLVGGTLISSIIMFGFFLINWF